MRRNQRIEFAYAVRPILSHSDKRLAMRRHRMGPTLTRGPVRAVVAAMALLLAPRFALRALGLASLAALTAAAGADGGPDEPPVQRNPQVGESRHDSSPPLREIPPAPRQPGVRVHEVKPIPRPRPPPDAGTPAPEPGEQQQDHSGNQ
jgi:hypothetical protein